MNIFIKEVKSELKPLFFWTVGLAVLVFAGLSKFSVMAETTGNLNDIVNSMPKILRALFGFVNLDLSTISGYFGILFNYVILMGIIFAAMMGSKLVSKEELMQTSEFLLVKPRSRKSILFSKILAGLLMITLFSLFTYFISLVAIEMFSSEPGVQLLVMNETMSMFIIMILFFFIGIFMATLVKKPRTAQKLTMSIVFITFMLSILYDMMENPGIVRYFTPFRYFPIAEIIDTLTLNSQFLLLAVALIFGLFSSSIRNYNNRDMAI
ncbi:MAG: ABC transporter permease subunit [Clostridiaceae bacterium]